MVDQMKPRADLSLVLGGGGVAGVAWMTGMLAGLATKGLNLADAGTVLGTSAGAIVGAQLTSGTSLPELFDAQVKPDHRATMPPTPPNPVSKLLELIAASQQQSLDPVEQYRAIGRMALESDTILEKDWRSAIGEILPNHQWPVRNEFWAVSLNADTGETELLRRGNDVQLVTAVAASCAIPGVFPPITIGHNRYMDGGIRSATNLDLAADPPATIVMAPMPDPILRIHADARRRRGQRILVLTPDSFSRNAFSVNPLDPAVRSSAASAGFAQGRSSSCTVAAL